MRGTFIVLGALAILPWLGGCAAVANMGSQGGCKVFGGTQLDATLVSEGLGTGPEGVGGERLERPALVWEACCGLVDLPLSAVADTLTLPVTVPVTLAKQSRRTPPDATSPGNSDTGDAKAPREP